MIYLDDSVEKYFERVELCRNCRIFNIFLFRDILRNLWNNLWIYYCLFNCELYGNFGIFEKKNYLSYLSNLRNQV